MPSTSTKLKQTLREILSVRGGGNPGWNHMDEVYPGIYLGGEEAAKNVNRLKEVGITHVLNASYYNASTANASLGVYTNLDFYEERQFHCKFLGIPALDFAGFNISQFFEQSSEFIDSALKTNGKILVHCFMGVSRSATIVIAYLMMRQNKTATEALKQIRTKRNIFPNDGFLDQICELEKKLRG